MQDEKRYEDKILLCRECGREFVFTGAEQAFYAGKGLTKLPRRCKDCRRAARSEKELYRAVCAACGKEARVPFPPREDRLAYCRDCYTQILAEKQERSTCQEQSTRREAQRERGSGR